MSPYNSNKLKGFGFQCPVGEHWGEHVMRVTKAIEQNSEIHEAVKELTSENGTLAKNLAALPEISNHLQFLNDNIIGPATGRKQIPMSGFLIVVLALCVVIVFQAVDRGKKDFDASRNHLKISNPQQQRQTEKQHEKSND